jgi:ATP-dependent RNA helicase DDX46/PRP5
MLDIDETEESPQQPASKKRRKGGRWDQKTNDQREDSATNEPDLLDQFMNQLQSSSNDVIRTQELNITTSGSMLLPGRTNNVGVLVTDGPKYTPNDWMSDTGSATEDDEQEEEARRKLIDALKAAAPPPSVQLASHENEDVLDNRPIQLAAEVKSEKLRREHQLKQLELEAQSVRQGSEAAPDFGRMYNEDGDVMEEAERTLQVLQQAPDALTVLAELNKKKEIQSVDHSKIDYHPLVKNLYRVPRSLASLTQDEIINRRAKLQIKVRGQGTPAPVSTFEECGLSDKILQSLKEHGISQPFPVQAQCIPCIMAGRDVIGIAKTGSGKTLAYLLPMLRHIQAQPPLAPNESGPIGLILAPARELAFQIFSVCKQFAKPLGLK